MHPLLRLPFLPLLAIVLVVRAAPVATPLPPPGAVDVAGPRSDGRMVAAVTGPLLAAAVAQVEPTTTLPEAPSSITARDQTRGALVLGITLAVMVVFVAVAAVGARRRRDRPRS